MTRRAIAGAGAAAVGAATAVTALVLGTVTGYAEAGTSSAFGVSAEGIIPIDPTPYIESTDGSEQKDDLVNIPLGEFGEVRAATLIAGNDVASTELAGVELGNDMGSISASVVKVACEGDTGTVYVADLNLNGQQITLPPADQNPVNETIDASPLAKITYNQQIQNADGTFTVNGLVIELLTDTEAAQKVVLGSATCGGPAGDDGGDDGDDNGDGPTATKPAPITTGLPVTG